MFANQTRAPVGHGSLAVVAAIIVVWLAGAGLFLKVYREGGAQPHLDVGSSCRLVCSGAPLPAGAGRGS